MAGKSVDPLYLEHYQTAVLVALGKLYHDRGLGTAIPYECHPQQQHLLFKAFGSDTGVDSITDIPVAEKLLALMDAQDAAGHLPKPSCTA